MKIGIITGASSGIGKEYVFALDKQFELDEIWVIARRKERLEELQELCKTVIRPIALDLANEQSFDTYKALLEESNPEIQILINGAGFGIFGTFKDVDLKQQLKMIDLNSKALTAICHISIPYMPEGSHLINIASNSSWQPVPYINVYGSTKAYVLNFSRALGVELKSSKIHVMAVCPHWIKTEFFDHAVQDDTIKYYDRFYTAKQVVDKTMKDLKKNRTVSILGVPVKMQVLAVKFLPKRLIMWIWCKQQGK